MPARRRPICGVVAAAVLVSALASCAGERPRLLEASSTTTSTTEAGGGLTEIATAKDAAIEVFADATSTSADRTLIAGEASELEELPIVFVVIDRSDERIEVRLPVGPAGSTGWVREADVTRSAVPYRVEVDLTARRLRVLERGTVILDEPAGVGTEDRPDPGDYFVRGLLQPPEPDGAYGAFAYALSGYPIDLRDFERGSGVVGITGTDDPDAVGTITGSGSVRLADDVLARLVDEVGLPLGTPVVVRA